VRRLWAVARTTLREAVRTRTAAVILVTLLAVVVLSPFLLRGTGKLAERVQLVLTYSLGAVGFLLALLTIFLSTSTLAGDLRDKRIETIATKPIARWQIVVGKWLGVMLLNVALVLVSGVVSYMLVRHVIGSPSVAPDDEERQQLINEVYTARHTVDPTLPDFEVDVDREIRARREAGEMPREWTEAEFRKILRTRLRTHYDSLGPGEVRGRVMERVMPASRDEQLFLRYKVLASGPREERPADKTVLLRWVVSPTNRPIDPDAIIFETRDTMDDFHEVSLPAQVVGPDNRVYIACGNVDPRLVDVGFPTEAGVQLLYTAGTFEGNFVRTMLLIIVRLAFLAALALAAAAVLSFPVASLFTVFVFMCALLVNHFMAIASPIVGTEERPTVTGTEREPIYETPAFHRVIVRAVAAMVPNFGRYDGVGELATGKIVLWRLVVRGLVVVGAIYGGVVMALGCLYFRARELADVGPSG